VPRETLTRDRIVAAAIELLDAEGLDGLSMRALGERLGSAATAVYWHVGSRGNLVVLAGDRVWSEIPLPELAGVDWRTAAASMASELRAMLMRHPWLVQAFGSQPIFGPARARHDDHFLGAFEGAGFASADADRAVAVLFTFVLGNVLGHTAVISIRRKLERTGDKREFEDAMVKAREIALQFPRLAMRVNVPAADYAAAPEATFELGLQAILDGLEARLPSRPLSE
jgi:AcrR family transcriptional regulator